MMQSMPIRMACPYCMLSERGYHFFSPLLASYGQPCVYHLQFLQWPVSGEKNQFSEDAEDWHLSQFWYDDATSEKLATEAVEQSAGSLIGCISTPSVFKAIKRLFPAQAVYLLEYDQRFSRYGDAFIPYDYSEPLNVPAHLHHSLQVVVADPPYISEECQSKTVETIRLVASPTAKIIINTGRVMEPLLAAGVANLRLCSWRPRHKRHLGNEFCCFANYESSVLGS